MTARLVAAFTLALLGMPLLATGATRMQLEVDAREAPRRVLHARLTIPVAPGPLTLVYPKWLPGTHGPTGPVSDLVGLRLRAAGQPVTWQRDNLDLYAFRVTVPDGVTSLDVSLDLVSGLPDGGLASPASLTTELAMIKWGQLVLYPAGAATGELEVEPSIVLPDGWEFATALEIATPAPATPGSIRFAPVSLTTLVDSPLLAGRYFQRLSLDESSRPVVLAVAADSAAALNVSPATGKQLRNLVREADALFGARQFRRYTFLVTLSDQVAQYGLESHESSENRLAENSFTNPAVGMLALPLLAHEYVHSWNGKYRRPDGLVTPDFQSPMRGDLLWVYEGLTQYLGHLLSARSGLWPAGRYRDRLAQSVAYYAIQPGRSWRPVADTAVAAQQLSRASRLWRSYRRSADYYNEGALVWLEADMLIREETRGRRSLDDFCLAFFGGNGPALSGPPRVESYAEDDVYAALNTVLRHDWRRFFAERITAIAPPPVGGLERGGWRLAFGPERNAFLQDIETWDPSATMDLAYSLGMRLNTAGLVDDIFPDTPADAAGLAPGMQVRAVNGRRWSASRLREAIAAAQSASDGALALLVENGDRFETLDLRYAGGLREPRLEQLPSGPDRLGASIAPRAR
ncbi:MAG: M61 family metallopeptidase [Chromatiales bacterium]|nr:M61 family metallopeptidase [Chromatiales bacterium]